MNVLITTSGFSQALPEAINFIPNPHKRRLTEAELIALFDRYDPVGMIAGVEPITARALSHAPNLRCVSRCGIGIDAIDCAALAARGIALYTTPDAPTASVAELALTMMLALLKRILPLDSAVRAGGWKGAPGRMLAGRRVGIFGCGRIGSYVARLAEAFGANVFGCDPHLAAHPSIPLVSIDELLSGSDVLSLHMPLTPQTRHIIDAAALSKMRPGAILINVSRGGLIDEDALYAALYEKRLAGAGLDCFESEPYAGKLATLENVCLSPHMGASAIEARAAMEREALDNLLRALKLL